MSWVTIDGRHVFINDGDDPEHDPKGQWTSGGPLPEKYAAAAKHAASETDAAGAHNLAANKPAASENDRQSAQSAAAKDHDVAAKAQRHAARLTNNWQKKSAHIRQAEEHEARARVARNAFY